MRPSQLRAAAFAYEQQEDPRFELSDRATAMEESIRADDARMAELDELASESFSAEDITQLFTLLADCKESNLTRRIADGDSSRDMFPGQLDVFARWDRFATRAAAERKRVIDSEIGRELA
jgi:hypothetical protein